MVARNENFGKLQAGYLFPEITRRRRVFQEQHPNAKIISLGIGNTTEPITSSICKALTDAAAGMGTIAGYSGYGDEQGQTALREAIADAYYHNLIKGAEVFVSDGAKCDIGRLQLLFGPNTKIAVQDPSYPVYVDSGVILGQTGFFEAGTAQFQGITYLPCNPENKFFPELHSIPPGTVIYFCSPNNPTGAVASREQLQQLVEFARKYRCIIVFDAAYALYISDPKLPRSIYEIPGAREVAIEVNSFSKPAGFTGLRLGWTVVPSELVFDDGTLVRNDWNRIMTTLFNGASNVVQKAGLFALSPAGLAEMRELIAFYMGNAQIIRKTLLELDFETYGGDNAPYIWARMRGMKSWEAFEELLNKAHVVTTPGSGFGPAGEGFLRFSCFGHRPDVEDACERLTTLLRR